MTQHLTYESLVNHVDDELLKMSTVIEHLRAGTMDQLYHSTVDYVVEHTMMMPTRRGYADLDTQAEQHKTSEATKHMVASICAMCNRTLTDVENDLVTLIKKFPIDDVSAATKLRRANQLN